MSKQESPLNPITNLQVTGHELHVKDNNSGIVLLKATHHAIDWLPGILSLTEGIAELWKDRSFHMVVYDTPDGPRPLQAADDELTMYFGSLDEACAETARTDALPDETFHVFETDVHGEQGTLVGDMRRQSQAHATAVATYVEPKWREWLEGHRIELNAMTTAPVDRASARKVGRVRAPQGAAPLNVTTPAFEQTARDRLRRALVERALQGADIETNRQRIMSANQTELNRVAHDFHRGVPERLSENPNQTDVTSWTDLPHELPESFWNGRHAPAARMRRAGPSLEFSL